MNSVNPYAPPAAPVSDIADPAAGVQPVRIFSTAGRIGRLRLLAYSTGGNLLIAIVSGVLTVVGLATPGAFDGLFWLTMLVYVAFNLMLLIQRTHDMDLSGWVGLVAFIPPAALFWVFKGGTRGANRFGAPPPPNSLGVKILALFFPVVFVVGLLGAIAIPAYQMANLRAHSAQKL